MSWCHQKKTYTSLYYAAENGHAGVVRALARAGAETAFSSKVI